jgi:thiol-disulfide isomerase/thioredoxin
MFKKIFTIISITLFLVACDGTSTSLKIKGNTDLDDGSILYHIVADVNNQPKTLDTLTVNTGSFELRTEINEPNIHFLQVAGRQGNFPFIAENGTINIEVYKDSLGLSKATGTVSNDHFMRYKTETKVYIESLNAIGNDLQQAMILKDSLLAEDLQEQYQDVRNQIQEYELAFIKDATNSLVSVLILERFLANNAIPLNEAKTIYESFSERVKNTNSARMIQKQLELGPKAEIGQIAPSFKGPNTEGNQFALENGMGKVTLIEFWASWCRPCRIENPNLVQLYRKNKNRGFNIIGVSLDRDKNKWIQAIKDDGLVWNHVSNLKFWNDPIAKLYKVNAIPASFLLDENGIIVARDLRGLALFNKVEELLNEI